MTLSTPDKRTVEEFLHASVLPALDALARELTRRSRPASVDRDAETGALTLTVPAEGHRDFVYGVSEHKLPAFTAHDAPVADVRYEARTFYSDGSRGYDIMGMADNQIINDVLFQFER
ncbi:high-affinity choline transport protein [Sinorhizobium sp. KGO-5]|nr:high-affinity choline transport protein [Sinorhizobium sp. KGO-5]